MLIPRRVRHLQPAALLLWAGLLLLALTACGKKGPVRPLEEKFPQQVQDAELRQRGDEFQLQWQMPQQNQDGSALDILASVEVERLIASDAEYCSECTEPWPLVAQIRPQLPEPAQRIGARYLLNDRGPTAGQVVRYRLTPRTNTGEIGLALILRQRFHSPLPAPAELSASAHDRSVELHWLPASPPTGASLVGYQVYRRDTGQPFHPLPLNPLPLQTAAFSDFGLENGRSLHYRVRALFDFAGKQVESLPSPEVSATPAAG